MAVEFYNILNENHPVYVELAKKTKSTRRRVQLTTMSIGILALVTLYSNSSLRGIGGRVNQFGVVHRK